MRMLTVLCTCLLFLFVPSFGLAWDLGATLTDHLTRHFPWPQIEVRDILCTESLPQSPPESITVEKGPPGKSLFSLEFRSGKRIQVAADVRAFDRVVMTARSFGKGHIFEKEDLYVKLVDVLKMPKNALKETEDAEGRQLSRSVVANAPLSAQMVTSAQSVRKGKKVLLVIDAPGFRITTTGETQESAPVGKHVRVVNQTTRKTMTGLLIDDATVKVDF
jgi:flagella basal body P-ring formation protein FlgA